MDIFSFSVPEKAFYIEYLARRTSFIKKVFDIVQELFEIFYSSDLSCLTRHQETTKNLWGDSLEYKNLFFNSKSEKSAVLTPASTNKTSFSEIVQVLLEILAKNHSNEITEKRMHQFWKITIQRICRTYWIILILWLCFVLWYSGGFSY